MKIDIQFYILFFLGEKFKIFFDKEFSLKRKVKKSNKPVFHVTLVNIYPNNILALNPVRIAISSTKRTLRTKNAKNASKPAKVVPGQMLITASHAH